MGKGATGGYISTKGILLKWAQKTCGNLDQLYRKSERFDFLCDYLAKIYIKMCNL
jgi:hypothetical protein